MKNFKPAPNREHNKLNGVFGSIAFGLLIAAIYLTLSHHPYAVKINLWQAGLMKDNKYFSVLTIFLLALPPLVVLLIIKAAILKLIKK